MDLEHGAPQAKEWIPKHLSEFEARLLHRALMTDESLIPGLVRLIPDEATLGRVKTGRSVAGAMAGETVKTAWPFTGVLQFTGLLPPALTPTRYASAKYAQKLKGDVGRCLYVLHSSLWDPILISPLQFSCRPVCWGGGGGV